MRFGVVFRPKNGFVPRFREPLVCLRGLVLTEASSLMRRTVEQVWSIDIGTLRRAGYVGEPALNWWRSRDKLYLLGIWP
jgi:hypothetical protein